MVSTYCLKSKKNPYYNWHRNRIQFRFLLILLLSFSTWYGYKQFQIDNITPEAVLVLGGHEEREKFAAELARKNSKLDIWVSSGSPRAYVQKIFTVRGIKKERLHLDYRASDTLTNFTTIVDELKAQNIKSVYLITSKNHMSRARIIGRIVLGSKGIAIEPISVPSKYPPEPAIKSFRDGIRAIFWSIAELIF